MVFARRVNARFTAIRVPGITSATIQRSQKPLIPFSQLKEFYAHPDAFYWLVWTYPSTSRWKTVRSWVTRRVRSAMTEALREKGFDRLGRRITAPGHTHYGATEPGYSAARATMVEPLPGTDGSGKRGVLRGLTGMVVLRSLPAAVTIPYDALKKEMGQAVDGIVKTCSKP
ncbi:MAG: hypothetical protein M1839_006922 [Geoglossum umbratile]|nr:MAG: hypothetical protein M1839_006922 [Geoglossum umbratile]